jgi:hypothetical protein
MATGGRPGAQVRGCLVDQAGQGRAEQADLDQLAAPGPLPLVEGGQDAGEGVQPGQHVDQRDPDLGRLAAGWAGDAHEPAGRLDQEVVAGQVGPRPAAEAGDRAPDQAGVPLPDPLVAKAEPLQGAGLEVLDQHVGPLGQGKGGLPAPLVLEVEGGAALVAVDGQVVGAVVAEKRRAPGSGLVAAVGMLDLDHVGSEVAQQHGRERTGQHPRQVGDQQPLQGTTHRRKSRSGVGSVTSIWAFCSRPA